MGHQDNSIKRSEFEDRILDLEKKYFNKLKKVFESEGFINDLLLIEKEIREKYDEYQSVWDLKNKLKIPAERLVRHHIYMGMFNEITGIYPSPVSPDIGVKMNNEAIICVDIKTLDTEGNSVDISSTSVEPNQVSFDNKNYPYIKTVSNLKSLDHYSRLPVLTYIIKIIYSDDKHSFKLSRISKPSLVLTCIPNGEVSKLFDYNIIHNFKTYSYYSEKDDIAFKEMYIPDRIRKEDYDVYIENKCVGELKFTKVDLDGKVAYYDHKKQALWWKTSSAKKPCIRAVKSGSTARLINDVLKKRLDSSSNPWDGYIEMMIPAPLK